MSPLKSLEYVTDAKGHKKSVVLSVNEFEKWQEEFDDLQDALALEKARKNATGFMRWKDFLKEIGGRKKAA
jgi:hypothetical protein